MTTGQPSAQRFAPAGDGFARQGHYESDEENDDGEVTGHLVDQQNAGLDGFGEAGGEDDVADHDRDDGPEEHRACTHILDDAYEGVVAVHQEVHGHFDGGVQHLCHQNQGDGEKQYQQLEAADGQEQPRHQYQHRRGEVDADVALSPEGIVDATECMVHAVHERRHFHDPNTPFMSSNAFIIRSPSVIMAERCSSVSSSQPAR